MDKRLDVISELYQEYIIPEIEKEGCTQELIEDGALFYMNSRNGTMFDVTENHHLPTLSTFYVEGKRAFSRMFIYKNIVEIYFYKKGELSPYKEVTVDTAELNNFNFSKLFDLFYLADLNGIWNENINKIVNGIKCNGRF